MDAVQIAGIVTLVGGIAGGFWLMTSPREETYEAMEERLLLLRVTGIVLVPAAGLVGMGIGLGVSLIYLAALLGLVYASLRRGAIDQDEIRVFGVWVAAGLLVWLIGAFRSGVEFFYMLAAGILGGIIITVDRCFGGRCRPRFPRVSTHEMPENNTKID